MKLSVARAICETAKQIPLLEVKNITSDKFGSSATMYICGDHRGYYLQGNSEGSEWWVAHFVYGGAYAEGSTPQEAAVNFANKLKWVVEEKRRRKLAAKIVEKYGE